MEKRFVKTSKFLSLVLRHKPEAAGIRLDQAGWVAVAELLAACNAHGIRLTREELEEIVRSNDKQRFAFNADHSMIRANQGHSVEVELEYEAARPPEILYHGTATRFLDSIKEKGLIKGSRHHVHLSADASTAVQVGARHGKPVVLKVAAGRMHKDGFTFYLSKNGVWLTDGVPTSYLDL